MAMSRKHYRKTADILSAEMATARTDDERRIIRNVAYSMADMFRQDNPNFDRAKFYAAAGVPDLGRVGRASGPVITSDGDDITSYPRAATRLA